MSIAQPASKAKPSGKAKGFRRGGIWRTFRTKIVIALVAFGLTLCLAVSGAMILNARVAVKEEVQSSFAVASLYIQSRKAEIEQSGLSREAFGDIDLHAGRTRHVRTIVVAPEGAEMPAKDSTESENSEELPPAWFVALLNMEQVRESFEFRLRDGEVFTIIIESEPFDEIVEVWQDFRFVVPMTIGYTIVLLGASLAVINHLFTRIGVITDGIRQLEVGNLGTRLGDTGIPELEPIVERVNQLAERLSLREDENREISLRLLTAQDDERRLVAHDLHDELGPYLFGLRAAAQRLIVDRPVSRTGGAAAMRDAATAIADIAQSIQLRMRKLLSTLRPMSLGEVPLADLLGDLIATLSRLADGAEITLDARTGATSYGEALDLTVYRFVQESIVNSLKHGRATSVHVDVENVDPSTDGRSELRIRVSDNGTGLPAASTAKPGYGFIGTADRVKALGGTWHPPSRANGMTISAIVLPFDACTLFTITEPDMTA